VITPLEPGDPRSAGDFRLRARLGTGGMGQVYLGYSPGGRAVAVKICHPEFASDQSFLRRFALEVAAARSVSGMFTAQVIGAGPDDDPPWLATVYVPGPSLYDTVQAYGPLPEQATWRLAAGLAEALRDIHAHGLVHRDLKPTNVLLATDGPRVIDFGVARAAETTALTTTGTAFGTPAYMSPEQAEGSDAGPESDIFSLGCVLCYAATRDTPFGDGPPPTLLYRVIHTQPQLGAVPAQMRPLMTACLDKDPAKRPTLQQILGVCQQASTAGAAGEAGVTTAPAFWPADVSGVIGRYQAALDAATRGLPDSGEQTLPVSQGAPGWSGPGSTGGSAWPVSRRASTAPPGRRRVITGLAGLAAVGLGAGGWEWAQSGSHRPAPQATGHQPGQLVWSHRTGGAVTSGAVISGGIVYSGSGDRHVYGFDAATGRLVVTFPLGGAVSGGLAEAGGVIYAGCADHNVYALGGGHSWTAPTGGPVNGTPVVSGGVVYVGCDDHFVYALDSGTGHQRWRYPTGGPVRSRPMAGAYPYDNYVYAGSDDGVFYALGTGAESFEGPKPGRPGWKYGTGGAVGSGAVHDSNAGLYIGSDSGHLYSLFSDGNGASAGPLNWRFPKSGAIGAIVTDPLLNADSVYFGSADGNVYAVDSALGGQLWKFSVHGSVRSSIAIDGTVLYAGADDGYLYAIDITSQTLRWKYRTGGPVRSRILVAGGLVYFGSLDRTFYAVKAS
jgi:outer membrane protein assembly factor BamB